MHLTCCRGRRGHTALGAETVGRDQVREGGECRDMCVCVCMCASALTAGSFSTRNERDEGRE